MSESAAKLRANLQAIQERIDTAAQRAGRRSEEVRLLAVTKYFDDETTRAVVEAGCRCLGESRPQQLWHKAAALSDLPQLEWHMVGHLQRNKIKRTLPLVSLIHSADNRRLLQALEAFAAEEDKPAAILIEINISGDSSKHGFAPEEAEEALQIAASMRHLRVGGLMAMAAREGDRDRARRDFAGLRELRDQLLRVAPPGITLDELSMGMSGDFEEAIAEGSTIVRIGSALLEGVTGG